MRLTINNDVMKTMEEKFQSVRLMDQEMAHIQGQGFVVWREEPITGDVEPEFTVEQKRIFWGAIRTKKTRRDTIE